MDERIEIRDLEQQEALCSQAVQEVAKRKEKASAELQSAASAEGRKSFFFGRSGSTRVEELAAAQTAVVEDLASKIDQEAVVKRKKEQILKKFRQELQQLDKSCVSHLQKLSDEFSSMWIETGQRLERLAAAAQAREDMSPAGPKRCYLPPREERRQEEIEDEHTEYTCPVPTLAALDAEPELLQFGEHVRKLGFEAPGTISFNFIQCRSLLQHLHEDELE